MKRILALTLSLLMLLTIAAGCNKETPEEITDNRIATDLANQSGKYTYAHIEGTPAITDMQILHREETDNNTTFQVTATAVFDNAEIAITATMQYRLNGLKWNLRSVDVSKAEATVTDAPNKESILNELTNYMSLYGSALARRGEEYHNLTFRPQDADWVMQCEKGSKTATLTVSYTDENLAFAGSYTIVFGRTGWAFESVDRLDGRRHPLLRLTSLTKK